LKKRNFELLISFLAGASWALVVFGALKLFMMFWHAGLLYAILGAFVGAIGGLFLVLIVEVCSIQYKKLEELKRQTEILEKLIKDDSLSHH
jgi:ABC-type lipoprotein release transport system permease subunit